ncbi:MAG: ATP-grasp domain-containing protein, partial [Bacteroidales bacterium]|nr:ATP-grasp domain-containing protein [Bacteroidales bacterium]
LTYNGVASDIPSGEGRGSVIVLGSGAYRIGSSVEFDWCSVSAVRTLSENGYGTIMVNYNPETVSTDYDICDKLYFDELSLETVLEICRFEDPMGVIVSVGGQIPNNLAMPLHENGIRILGTSAEDIDRAEDRNKFSSVVDLLGIDQPKWKELTTMEAVDAFISEVGFPVLVRPSYVLSGAAMNVCYSHEDLGEFLAKAVEVSEEHPVVISSFMRRCNEIEFDAVADGGEILSFAISEHIEFAGVHSGDATIQFPAQKLYGVTAAKIRKISARIAKELRITGPFNIQFLATDDYIKVIECNLRASRSFPFVSKILKINLIDLATKAMLGLRPAPCVKEAFELEYVGVKASQFSFSRLNQADPVTGVDMVSTGEVGCIGDSFDEALLKSLLSVGLGIPDGPVLISSGDALQKADLLPACRVLSARGYVLYATSGTWRYLNEQGVPALRAYWPDEKPDGTEGGEAAMDLIAERKVALVINVPKNFTRHELTNGYKIRRAAVDHNVPLVTNARLASAFVEAFCKLSPDDLKVKAWDEIG